MPFFVVVVVVLTAWGVGAAVGSASTYLAGAVAGVAATLVIIGVFGAVSAWRNRLSNDELRVPRRTTADSALS